jgi:hypothetical protein
MIRNGSSSPRGAILVRALTIKGSTRSSSRCPYPGKARWLSYVGRLHRRHAAKTEVLVVDYVDELVPVLARMAAKRRTGYRALG